MPTVYLKGPGTVLLTGDNKVALSSACCCNPACPTIDATGTVSGIFGNGHESCAVDGISGSSTGSFSGTMTGNPDDGCSINAGPFDVDFTCPTECDPDGTLYPPGEKWDFSISLTRIDEDNWFLSLSVHSYSENGTGFCGYELIFGSEPILEDTLSDPNGTHTYSFDDPDFPDIHYEFEITIAV